MGTQGFKMQTVTVLISLTVAIAFVQAKPGSRCTDVTQCDQGECCQILSEFMVVSRRQAQIQTALPQLQTLPPPTHIIDLLPPEILKPAAKTGTCEKYTPEGAGCDTFAQANGYCGCEPGTQCHMFERLLPTDAKHPTVRSVRDLRPNRPGYEWITRCDKV